MLPGGRSKVVGLGCRSQSWVKAFGSSQARAATTSEDVPGNPIQDGAARGDSRLPQSRLPQLTILEAVHRDNNPAEDEVQQQGGQVLPPHLLDACAARMEAYKNCRIFGEETLVTARDQAASSQMRRLHGRAASTLGGVPLALKANFGEHTIPMQTRRTRLIPPGYRPAYDATLVKRLREAGMVFVGTTPFEEFGIGARDMFAVPDAVLNPWRSRDGSEEPRTAGGLVGGPACAVAAGAAYGALASDLGGSLRVPAAFTGTVGFKPSPGRLSKAGLITFAGRFDVPGVITRSVPDAALLTALLQGQDENDSEVVPACDKLSAVLDMVLERPLEVVDRLPQLLGLTPGDKPLKGMTVGITKEQLAHTGAPVQACMADALDFLEKAGAAVKEVGLPNPATFAGDVAAAFYRLAVADALTALEGVDSMLPGLDAKRFNDEEEEKEGKPHVEHARDIFKALEKGGQQGNAGASLEDARRFQDSITAWFSDQFSSQVDVFLLPSTSGVSPTISEAAAWKAEDKAALDAFNLPATLAGLPAISVPQALSAAEALPLGVQLLGPRLGEARLLAVARVLERAAQDGPQRHGLLPLTPVDG